MKRHSIWSRSIWDTKIGRVLLPCSCVVVFLFFLFQGVKGVLIGEAVIIMKMGGTIVYNGIAGRLLGGAYLCLSSLIVHEIALALECWYPKRINPRNVRLGIASLGFVFLVTAVILWGS